MSTRLGVRYVAAASAAVVALVACSPVDDAGDLATTTVPQPVPTTSETSQASTSISPGPTAGTRSSLSLYLTDPASAALDDVIDEVQSGLRQREDLPLLLHESALFPDQAPGRSEFAAPIGYNQNRRVIVRTPASYDPTRPWPLIIAYHVWGGSGDRILDRMENLLGNDAENYVIAAPDDYRQTILDAPPPVTSEHVSVWRHLKTAWHVDSDRMYVTGYSLGGETTMTLSTLHPTGIASSVAMAAGYSFPSDVDGLWEAFLPNLRDVPILHVWGADDHLGVPGLNGRDSDDTLSAQNLRLDGLIRSLDLDNYEHIALAGVGHSNAHPTMDQLLDHLSISRTDVPRTVHHTFRFIHQANAYWIEGHEWLGTSWTSTWPNVEVLSGESDEDALTRTIFESLGTIDASVEGQTIDVASTHLSDLTVWLIEGLIDWDEPVRVLLDGDSVFEGIVTPEVGVAISQAARTRDFDRLRWAGIRIDVSAGSAHVVTPDESFPPILREITIG